MLRMIKTLMIIAVIAAWVDGRKTAFLSSSANLPIEYRTILEPTSVREVPFTRTIIRQSRLSRKYPSQDKLDVWLNEEELSWEEAAQACKSWGGSLLQIGSRDLILVVSVVSIIHEYQLEVWVGHRYRNKSEVDSPLPFAFRDGKECGSISKDSIKALSCGEKMPSLCGRNALVKEVNLKTAYPDRFFVAEGSFLDRDAASEICFTKGGKLGKISNSRDEMFAAKVMRKYLSKQAIISSDSYPVRDTEKFIQPSQKDIASLSGRTIALCENYRENIWDGKSSFWVIQDTSSFSDAQSRCELAGGNLASIEDIEEQHLLEVLLSSVQASEVWIGLRQNDSGSLWTDGKEMYFSNLDESEGEVSSSLSCRWKRVMEQKSMDTYQSSKCGSDQVDSVAISTWESGPLGNRIFRYLLDDAPVVYYKRITGYQNGRNLQNIVQEWGASMNKPGENFELFSNEEDAFADQNRWESVDMNPTYGFPGNSGPTSTSVKTLSWKGTCSAKKSVEICQVEQTRCVSVSTLSGKWKWGPCSSSKPFVCKQRGYDGLDTVLDDRLDIYAQNLVWKTGYRKSLPEAISLCGEHNMYPYMPKSAPEEVPYGSDVILGLQYINGVWQWYDGERVNYNKFVEPIPTAESMKEENFRWVPSTDSGVLCMKEHHGQVFEVEAADITDFQYLSGSFLQTSKENIIVGDLEHGIIGLVPTNYVNNIGGTKSDTFPVMQIQSAQWCTRSSVEPHRYYCSGVEDNSCNVVHLGVEKSSGWDSKDGECFESSLNIAGQTFGPTSLAVNPVTGEVYFSIEKYGVSSSIKVSGNSVSQSYIGSLIIRQDSSSEKVLIAGGGMDTNPIDNIPSSGSSVKFSWVNAMAFSNNGEFLYIAERDSRQISCLLNRRQVFSVVCGGANKTPFQNSIFPELSNVKDGKFDIGVPQFLVSSKTIEGRLYLATLLSSENSSRKQRFSILEINVSNCTFISASYALRGRFIEHKGLDPLSESFTAAISGLDIDKEEKLYIAQKETGSLFLVDLSKSPSEGKLEAVSILRMDGSAVKNIGSADAIHVTNSGEVLLSSVYNYKVEPIRRVSFPYVIGSESRIYDMENGECKSGLTISHFFLVLVAIEEYVSQNEYFSDAVQDLIIEVRDCFLEFATEELEAGRKFRWSDLSMLQRMESFAQNATFAAFAPSKSLSALTHLGRIIEWYMQGKDSKYLVKYAPPPPQAPYGKSGVDEKSVAEYRTMFSLSAKDGLTTTCSVAVKTAAMCECGSIFTFGSSKVNCIPEDDNAKLANFYAGIVYCAFGTELEGKAALLTLPMLYYVRDCSNLESWKTNSQTSNLDLVEAMQAIAVKGGNRLFVSSTSDTSDKDSTERVHEEIYAFQKDLESARDRLVADTSLMKRFHAISVARPESICIRDGCASSIGSLADDLKLQITSIAMSEETEKISAAITQNTQKIQKSIENLGETLQNDIKSIATQISETTAALSTQITDSFQALAKVEQNAAESKLGEFEEKEKQLQQQFISAVKAIDADLQDGKEALAEMTRITDGLGGVTQKFYDCKKKQELARLARSRAMGIFNCVMGAVKVATDAAMFLLSGGASSAMKTISKAGAQGKAALSAAKKNVGSFIKKIKSSFSRQGLKRKNPVPNPKDAEDVKGSQTYESLKKVLDDGTNVMEACVGAVLTGQIDLSSPNRAAISIFTTAFKIGEQFGVPGAEGASQIMAGAMVLANYENQRKAVVDEYKKSMEASTIALETLSNYTRDISDFFTELTAEFTLMLVYHGFSDDSVIEGRSTSFWEVTEREIIYFIERTDIYLDFKGALEVRRLSSDEKLLGTSLATPNMLTDDNISIRLRGRAAATSENPLANAVNFRRALDDKDGCPQEELLSQAAQGMELFSEYKLNVQNAITYGRTTHERLRSTYQVLRDLIIVQRQIEGEKKNIQNWNSAYSTFETAGNKQAVNLNEFHSSMAIYRRKAPEITGTRDPRVYKVMTRLQTDSFTKLCTSQWYSDLGTLPTCDFRASNIFTLQAVDSNKQWSNIKGVIESIQDDFQKAQATSSSKRKAWFRTPIDSALAVRAQLGEGSTEDSVYRFELYDMPEPMKKCGHNLEVVSQTILLEQTSVKHFPIVEEFRASSVELDLQRFGPFLKTDSEGNKHVFDIQTFRESPKSVVQVANSPDAGFTNCYSLNSEVESFILRDTPNGQVKACLELPAETLDPLPLLGGYSVTLGKTFLKYIQDGRDDIQLVLYTQVSAQDYTSSECEAANFRSIGSNVKVSTEESILDNSSDGVSAGVIVGATIGGLFVVCAVVFVAYKLKQRKLLAKPPSPSNEMTAATN